MIRRLAYAVFFVFGGFLFAIPKWIVMGTKGGRERQRMLKLQAEQNRLLRSQRASGMTPWGYGTPSPDGRYWWDGFQWVLRQ